MVSKAHLSTPSFTAETRTQEGLFTTREWLYVGIVIAFVLVLTALPYLYAYRSAPSDRHFMGVMVNIPDHFQYFSWMRESRDQILVPNQLTPEDSTPLLFNFLWWTLGRIETLTGIDYAGLYQITRWLAGAFVMVATYIFCSVVFKDRAKRWTAFLISVFGAGLGWIWVVISQLTQPDGSLLFPFDTFTSEPNTFFNILAFPHFSIAAGLIALIFSIVLIGQRTQKLRYAWYAALLSLLLGVQHSYDMFIIYPVIGLYGLFIWIRDRKFPIYLFKLGVIVVLVSMWPALQAFYITQADEVWREVLAQFDNAGAFTPNPLHLPILMGIGWLFAIWAIDIRTPWRDRDDTHLLILAWFLAHFVLIYLPMDFQIHLLSGWQIVGAVLATHAIYNRVLPWLQKRFPKRPRVQLARLASAALLLAVIPTNLYIFAWRFYDLRRAEAPFFMSTDEMAAYDYLEGEVERDNVVLSSLTVGQFVPALTGARSYLGHWAQTLDFFGKDANVKTFFNEASSDEEREAILQAHDVDYVIYGEHERALGSFDPSDAPYLSEVFSSGDVKVFQVQ
jgi:hypothetical protein